MSGSLPLAKTRGIYQLPCLEATSAATSRAPGAPSLHTASRRAAPPGCFAARFLNPLALS